MPTHEENVVEAKKSSFTKEEIDAAYEKGRREGRIEGMLAYQKRMIINLQRDNDSLNEKLREVKK